MQINTLLKSLMIALPMFTLAACSSTEDSGAGVQEQGAETLNGGDQGLSADEQMRQKYEALRQDNTIYFGFDQDAIDGQYTELLQAHANFLRENNSIKVLVEGHTDERGSREYNLALGERRAQAAQAYLATSGVSASRMEAISYGEDQPADPGHDESAWAKNRRAEISY